MGTVIPRSAYQVFVFDLPLLASRELEAAARFRVRSLSPLHPDQYQVYLDVFRQSKTVTVLAFLVPGDLTPGPQARAEFPARLPRSWPRDLIVSQQAGDTTEFYVYRGGILKAALPPAGSPRAVEETWAALQREHPGLPVEARSFSGLPAAFFPRFRKTLPVDRSWHWAALPLVLGLGLAVWGGAQHLGRLEARNALWKTWLQERSTAPGQGEAARIEKRWKELQPQAGFPLLEVLSRMAARWPEGVRIVVFEAREDRLQIEAEAVNALKSIEALLADPWFASLKVVRIRTNPAGADTFLLEGEVSDDL